MLTRNVDEENGPSLQSKRATDCVDLLSIRDRVLADYLPQMIWIVRARDRALLYANPAFWKYLGRADATWEKRAAIFQHDNLSMIANVFEAAERDGSVPDQEVRIRGKDGLFRWFRIMLVPVKKAETILEWIVTALDIDDLVTARRKLQDATDLFSLSQEAAGAGSWDLDLRDSRVRLSAESARLHRIGDAAVEINLEIWRQIVDEADAAKVLEALRAAVDAKTTYNGEFRVRTGGGTVHWVSGIGRAYYDESGQPVRMIGLNFDITERKNAEGRLIEAKAEADQARKEAERASTAKGDFLASMSHEIRTPLNSIIGYTDLIMEEVEPGAPIRRKLEVVQESGSALLAIVNDILDFSKIEAGQVELCPVAFSPRALLENVASMMAGVAHRKGIAITRYVSMNVPDFVMGDESRLRQILLNLLSNAVKFTESGRVAINVGRVAAAGADIMCFSVADTGIGIAEEHRQRLFRRFSQVDGSISRKFGGTGLGLAICKQLVDLMGGEIGVESREGEGTRFWINVPLPLADHPRERDAASSLGDTPRRRARILLAEDILVNQELAKAVLERAGHVVDIVSNGAQAVDAVRETTYDLVLMDVQMPVMDGICATQAIRAADHPSRTVPIIAMTANVLPQQIAGLKSAGMDDHVGKPFRRQDLFAIIERWTRHSGTTTAKGAPPDETEHFSRQMFAAIEDLIGTSLLRVNLMKFSDELSSRFGDLGPSCDIARLRNDAHGMVQSAGLFGFIRLLSICQALNGGDAAFVSGDLLMDLGKERALVLAEVDRYLAETAS